MINKVAISCKHLSFSNQRIISIKRMHSASNVSPLILPLHRFAARSSQDGERQHVEPLETEPLIAQPTSPSSSGTGQQQQSQQRIDWTMTSLLFFFPALCGGLFGYDIGATSGALLSMSSPQVSGTDWYSLSPLQSGLIVSLSLAGALLGSLGALVYGDKIGRKKELLLGSALYGASAISFLFAPGYGTVLLGRLLYGVGIGFAMHAAPAYIAETSPSRVRGFLISLKEAFIVGGILAGYATSYLFVENIGGWRYMYSAAAIPALIAFAGMAWLPESPRWLALSGGGVHATREALKRAQGSSANEHDLQKEVSSIMVMANAAKLDVSSGDSNEDRGVFGMFKDVLDVSNRRPLTIGLSLMLFQQITGQPSVLYYAAKIFQAAGFADAEEATGVALILGVFKLLMTAVAVATVDRLGRRPLLLYGVSAVAVSLVILGFASSSVFNQTGLAAWINLGALLLYVSAYQVSFGPISWLIVGEVFPLKVRGQAIALASLTNFGSNFLVSLVLPTVQNAYGPASTYFIFSLIGVAAVVTIYHIVPETKGKTLEEIEALWSTGSDARQD